MGAHPRAHRHLPPRAAPSHRRRGHRGNFHRHDVPTRHRARRRPAALPGRAVRQRVRRRDQPPVRDLSTTATRSYYDITVRRVPAGWVSNLLIDSLAVGQELTTTGPMGTFHHNPLFHGDDVVFLAGGSGVAPAMSMIREIVDRGLDLRFHLLYGSRTADDVIFREELDTMAAEYPLILVDHVITDPSSEWEGATGFLTAETISSLLGPLGGRRVYVCGPERHRPLRAGDGHVRDGLVLHPA
ncbi:FAD-binding oxidoreductase [Streptomyces afghaniensis]|uniref:FAD-binding oxidoreductase n=1 Tax=Streptomyces afghaniensis TaxID=66865 RepID=UPI0037BC5A38